MAHSRPQQGRIEIAGMIADDKERPFFRNVLFANDFHAQDAVSSDIKNLADHAISKGIHHPRSFIRPRMTSAVCSKSRSLLSTTIASSAFFSGETARCESMSSRAAILAAISS